MGKCLEDISELKLSVIREICSDDGVIIKKMRVIDIITEGISRHDIWVFGNE